MGLGSARNQKEIQDEKNIKDPVSFIETSQPKWQFDRIILNKKTMSSIKEAIVLIKHRDKIFNEWGLNEIDPYKKCLALNFYGSPGTGKSISAEAFANELKNKIIKVNYADIESKYVGDTPKNITKLFAKAKETDSIIFFDEADSILGKRISNVQSSTDTSVNLTRSVMLLQLDSFEGIVIFATNLIRNFDKAFLRRIQSHIKFEMPDYGDRVALWKLYTPKLLPVDKSFSFEMNAEKSVGLSGSDIRNVIIKSAIKAAYLEKDIVESEFFIEKIDEIKRSLKDSFNDFLPNEEKTERGEYKCT